MRKSTLRALATVILAVAALHISRTEQAWVDALTAIPTTPTATPRPAYTPTITPTPGPSPTPTPHVSAVAKMEMAMDEFCRLKRFSGAVLVMRDGQVILERACGLADRSEGQPNTVDTRFLVGSLAAEFNATAVLLLEAEGRLALSDPLCPYLASCPEACREFTVEDLLLVQSLGDARPCLAATATEESVTGLPPEWRFDQVVSLAADLIEQAAGVPYDDYLASRILAPLQLRSTSVGAGAGPTAVGYLDSHPSSSASLGAGGPALYTTVDDLRRWDLALSENLLLGPVAVSRLFAPHRAPGAALYSCLAQLRSPIWVPARPQRSADTLGQAIGGTVLLEDGHHLVRAEGTAPGFRAFHLRYDKDGVTIISLSNQQDSLDIAYGLSDFALGWECPLG